MKKLKKAVIFLLAVSLVAIVVFLGGMKDLATLNRGSGSTSSDTDHGSESALAATDHGLENAVSDADIGSENAASATDHGSGSSVPFTVAGVPEASGTAVEESEAAVIDYSNTKSGYVMVDYTQTTGNQLKVQVAGPSTTYTYDLKAEKWTTFPLSDGNGDYKVTVYESMANEKYSTVLSVAFSVDLESEFAPFLHANQYVDYADAVNTMAKTAELTQGTSDTLEKVGKIYDYVIDNVDYDAQKAANIESGYLPVLDDVLASRKGICFDYAALMAGMLRSCDIPCKLVVGYAGDAYHAWISVWTEESGWLDDVIWFDGDSWQRMDPTFASANNGSDAVMQYIGDGNNYTAKYQY